jgi:hypothetical protein
MLLLALVTYHLASHGGPIHVNLTYQAAANRYGYTAGITSGRVTIDNGSRHFTIDLAKVVPITTQPIQISKDGGCGLLQPLAVSSHYVAVEVVWAEKGCRAAAYFIDANTGAIAETVDLDHRWNYRLDIQPTRFAGEPIRVEGVDHVILAQAHFARDGFHIDARVPWYFAIVRGRDATGTTRLYAYGYAKTHYGWTPDPGWNIFPSPGSVVYVGALRNMFFTGYHPDPEVLRLSAADDASYAARQEPTSVHDAHALQRNEWFTVMDEDAAASQFSQALAALAKMVSLDDAVDAHTRAGDEAMYEQCRAMIAQLQAGNISAASARTRWSNGCRP